MKAKKTKQSRSLALAASLIAEQFSTRHQTRPSFPSLDAIWQPYKDGLQKLDQLRKLSRERGWQVAEANLRDQIANELLEVQSRIKQELERLQAIPVPEVKINDIYRDLLGLAYEFPEVRYCQKSRQLIVVTHAIELEQLYLGPFEIRLDVSSLAPVTTADYQVLAVDPQPASASDNVTHPHVRDDYLCEGDATNSIKLALKQGRLFDFFLLVNGVLNTYNDESPYVRISQWTNGSCSDCGDSFDREDGSVCNCCESLVCSDCSHTCSHCDEACCHSCSRDCDSCQDLICHDCVVYCTDRNKSVCPSCFEHERFKIDVEQSA